jgi:two-component system KDP operon response regulator KdpE
MEERISVLVIDDDIDICDILFSSFELEGPDEFIVESVHTAQAGLERFFEWQPDVVVLDIGLPDMDGLEVLRQIRQTSSTPVIMLSGRYRENDIVGALDQGAVDYVTKPFRYREVIARVRARAHRAALSAAEGDGPNAEEEAPLN